MKANEFTSKSLIFVDIDGVLANLFGYMAEINNVEHYNRMTKAEWEKFFQNTDAEQLFANLPMFPTANKLLQMVVNMFGSYIILSSPLTFDRIGSIKGKNKWLNKNITVPDSGRIFERNKYMYACQPDGTSNVLIDDFGVNIKLWNNSGGIGIKFQTDENSLSELKAMLEEI